MHKDLIAKMHIDPSGFIAVSDILELTINDKKEITYSICSIYTSLSENSGVRFEGFDRMAQQ
jgi:hypothetical protein